MRERLKFKTVSLLVNFLTHWTKIESMNYLPHNTVDMTSSKGPISDLIALSLCQVINSPIIAVPVCTKQCDICFGIME